MMKSTPVDDCTSALKARYASELENYIERQADETLREAHEFGLEALAANLSIKDLVAVHSESLRPRLLNSAKPAETAQMVDRASEFLTECLSAFDTQEVLRNSRAKDEFMSAVSHELRT